MVRWDLEIVDTNSPYSFRLTLCHVHGSIVEYFTSTRAALRRQQELEGLLVAARGFEHSALAGARA